MSTDLTDQNISTDQNNPASWQSRVIGIVISLLAGIGLVDAIYLTISHFQNSTPTCSLLDGCNIVLTSQYATLEFAGLAVPLALVGAAYYAFILTLSVGYVAVGNRHLFGVGLVVTGLGLVVSAWLVYLQAFVLEAFCQYCLLSALLTTGWFVLAGYAWLKARNNDRLTLSTGAT